MDNNFEPMKTNKAIEDLKSSMTNLTDIVKTLQSLSGRLSSIGDECKNIGNVSKQLQSQVSKMEKSLCVVETKFHDSNPNLSWYQYKQISFFEPLLKPTVNRHWSFERRDKTFKKHLLNIGFEAFYDLNYLYNFLYHVSKYNGYVYGGLVRDFIVPIFVYGTNSDNLDFKDIDIWFSNQSDSDDFIESLNKGIAHLSAQEMDTYDVLEGYGAGQKFTRRKFHYSFNNLPLFMVDIMVSEQLPVNDFSVNLLLFRAKNQDFKNMSLSWFSVGDNPDAESYKYSVMDLIQMIEKKNTDVLKGYSNHYKSNKKAIDNYSIIIESRLKRMEEWGWTLTKN